ncbi:unnamed protein product [Symbiodinium necroappetens]|uniref:SAP domain-containing protein n=2 Tax=Symbiodinium TaxID=2949 RepID=A0A813B304_9DINO|nr:hypothetical protein AK812_SmicGene41914 [Symbiodinium microadriaticum]CAE7537970.1 unnamed protein product [Symbiodinium microadriaticum]CAE7888532.1 unnamed protein product [Symbiodinium necroappetens]CAE7950003.1 unnamed protein product [Symbiodinium sp. KB8]
MALALPVQWPRLGHMGPGRRHHVARQCSNQSWRVQAATLGGTLVSLLKALRQAGVAERRRRLREATTAQLRIISAGLRLRAPVTPVGQGSRAALMARIEEALAQDARLAAPDQPIGRILRSLPTDKTDQFEQLMIDRLSCAKLKGLCRPLRLSTAGRKAELANQIIAELMERHPPGFQEPEVVKIPAMPRARPGHSEPDAPQRDSPDRSEPEDVEDGVLIPTVLVSEEERRQCQQAERRQRRRNRFAEILAEELSCVVHPQQGATC